MGKIINISYIYTFMRGFYSWICKRNNSTCIDYRAQKTIP